MSNTNPNKFNPKCVNCNGKHTANDVKNCPYIQKALEKRDEQKAQKTNSSKSKSSTKPIVSSQRNASYADMVRSNTSHRSQSGINNKHSGGNKNTSNNKRNNSSNSNVDKNNGLEFFLSQQQQMMCDFMVKMQNMQMSFISTYTKQNGS